MGLEEETREVTGVVLQNESSQGEEQEAESEEVALPHNAEEESGSNAEEESGSNAEEQSGSNSEEVSNAEEQSGSNAEEEPVSSAVLPASITWKILMTAAIEFCTVASWW